MTKNIGKSYLLISQYVSAIWAYLRIIHGGVSAVRQQLLLNEYDRLCDTLTELRQALDLILADVAIVERTFPSATTWLDTLHIANATVKAVHYATGMPIIHPSASALAEWDAVLIELVQNGEHACGIETEADGRHYRYSLEYRPYGMPPADCHSRQFSITIFTSGLPSGTATFEISPECTTS